MLDKRFAKYKIGNTPIQRLHTGMLWAEGPAWNGVGRYLVWSDIPNNVQMRWLEEDGHVSVFRNPSGNSNGNTFDWEGRQISCEHGNRRVVRYEHNGTVTVLADKWQGKPLNAPNDVVVHPDGGIWFTDPGYGSLMNYEGQQGRAAAQGSRLSHRRQDRQDRDGHRRNLQAERPVLFARLQEALRRRHRRVALPDAPKNIKVWDVVDAKSLKRQAVHLDGSARQRRRLRRRHPRRHGRQHLGRRGLGRRRLRRRPHFRPDGERIGQILLPEICANVCFGGAKRNRLFMTASQSLYAVYVGDPGRTLGLGTGRLGSMVNHE